MREPYIPLQLPSAPIQWEQFIAHRCDSLLDEARTIVADLKALSGAHAGRVGQVAEQVVQQWNDTELALSLAASVASLIGEVHPDEKVRTLAEDRSREVQKLITELGQDRELYAVLVRAERELRARPEDVDPGASRLLRLSLRDFRRAGVDRDDATRDRLRELAEHEVKLGQDFARNIRDDVRSVRLRPERLAGLPEDFVQSHPAGGDGLVEITTDYPDITPFRSFGEDAAARRELVVAFLNRGWPANDAVLRKLLATRAEHAALLGYAGWPDFDAEVKMVGSAKAIEDFIEQITEAAKPSSDRDTAVLLDRLRRDRPDSASLDAADVPFYSELVRRENFEVDAQDVRRYFNFAQVRAGLLDVTSRLFGLRYELVADAPVWHEDVAVYDARSADGGELLGRIYLDLHPRAGKFKHAAQFDLVAGVEGKTLPEGALVCNLGRGLLEHSDVVTLFHEFGHLVHHVLAGRQRYARFSGVATEWDFVEAPSQLLEEWAWDTEVLQSFAVDERGIPIPSELVAKMRIGHEFGKGYQARTQMFYAAMSFVLHSGAVDDLTETVRELQGRYDAFDYIADTHLHTGFGHLEGYSSAYYTYMWSLVIAKDMFSAFDPADLFDRSVSYRYRDRVLAGGGSQDAADLVADFLGRPYAFDAFAHWLATEPSIG